MNSLANVGYSTATKPSPEIHYLLEAGRAMAHADELGSVAVYNVGDSDTAKTLAGDIANWAEFHYGRRVYNVDCSPDSVEEVKSEVDAINRYFDDADGRLIIIRNLDRLIGANGAEQTPGQILAESEIEKVLKRDEGTELIAISTTPSVEIDQPSGGRVSGILGSFASTLAFEGQEVSIPVYVTPRGSESRSLEPVLV